LFEASDRIGGRVYPTRFEHGYIQLGAEFINGVRNPIYKMASSLGVVGDIIDDIELFDSATFMTGECELSPSDLEAFHQFADKLDPKYRRLARSNDPLLRNRSIADLYEQDYAQFLREKNPGRKRKIFDALSRFYQSYFEGEWAGEWSDLSIRNLVQWNDWNERSDSFKLNQIGYKAILDLISARPAPYVRFNSRVVLVDYGQPDGVRLTLSDGVVVNKTFDYVIVTSALGHLKKFARQMFKPQLPRYKLHAIDTIGFGNLAKIFYVYDEPFWDRKETAIVTLPIEECSGVRPSPFNKHFHTFVPLSWHDNVLMNWQSGQGPPAIDDLSDEELSDIVTHVLRRTFNNASLPAPRRIIRERWSKNDLFGGSYSYISVASARENVFYDRMSTPVRGTDGRPRLLFAGEATHNRVYQTTIGAWQSGRREADRIAGLEHTPRTPASITLGTMQ
jgi:spermine oxidase